MMRSTNRGAQRASGQDPFPDPNRRPSRRRRLSSAIAVVAIALVTTGLWSSTPTFTRAAATYILMPRAELLALPATGIAWDGLKSVADASLGAPDLCSIDSKHHLRTLAAALVYARTGVAAYGAKARAGILEALPTQIVGCGGGTLALGRQLTAYVLAANLAGLSGTEDATFRAWLSAIRTKIIGGHSVWTSLRTTHLLAGNNWGAHAGAARIAADLYLGDAADLAVVANVTRGFLGNRAAYAGFSAKLDADDLSWTCSGSAATFTPENPACTKSGINIDGGFISDISRGGSLRWPPADPGIPYQLESIQGLGMQVELLYRNGFSDAWTWSNAALKRAAGIVTRSGASGGTGWNLTTASRQMPWLLNKRLGLGLPTRTAGMGRSIGFTDWLYGSPGSAGTTGGGSPPPPPPPPPPGGGGVSTPAQPPVATAPRLGLGGSAVPAAGVPVVIRWSLVSTSNGLRRYDLQMSRNRAAWTAVALFAPTTPSRWITLGGGASYVFRVRAIDLSGRVGAWAYMASRRPSTVNDPSLAFAYRGTWGIAGSTQYIGGAAHWTRTAGATSTFKFSGSSFAWFGPVGPGRGRSIVSVDGVQVATVDQVAATFVARRLLYARNMAAGTHTVVIKALGTTGRPMVAIDGMYVLGPG